MCVCVLKAGHLGGSAFCNFHKFGEQALGGIPIAFGTDVCVLYMYMCTGVEAFARETDGENQIGEMSGSFYCRKVLASN